VVSIVLEGARTPRTGAAAAQFTMPGFAWRLSDQDVADVVNFVRTSWGNHASATTVDAVTRTRSSLR
jgi:mono/diheme cytochrome c family protein